MTVGSRSQALKPSAATSAIISMERFMVNPLEAENGRTDFVRASWARCDPIDRIRHRLTVGATDVVFGAATYIGLGTDRSAVCATVPTGTRDRRILQTLRFAA
jgi:hypothetical protein